MMRRGRTLLLVATLLLALVCALGARAADPSISVTGTERNASGAIVAVPTPAGGQLPVLSLGTYAIVTGLGFPPNQPVQAYLVTPTGTNALTPQDLTASITTPQQQLVTDATGGFQNLAFALPAAGTVTGTTGQIVVGVGTATAAAPVRLDSGSGGAVSGDKLAVAIALIFYAIVAVPFILLLRGLPVYPMQRPAQRRMDEPNAT